MTILKTMGALSFAAMLLACDRADMDASKNGSTGSQTDKSGVTNRQPTVDRITVNQLARARCDREMACNNVGGGLKYATQDVCLDEVRGSIGHDLNSYSCPAGFDRELGEPCRVALRSAECGHPLDTLQRVDKCRTDALCAKPESMP